MSLILGQSSRGWVGPVLVVALLATIAAQKVVLVDTLTPDAFWHLRVADELAGRSIGPLVDRISFMSIPEPWTPYSWLAELAMRAIWQHGGLWAAVLTHVLVSAALVVLSALACCTVQPRPVKWDDRSIPIIVSVALGMLWTQWFVSFRPVSGAFVLLWSCVWLLFRDRRLLERSRAVWLVVPIVAVGVNIHFFAMLVPLWVGALFVGALIDRSSRSARRYGLLLVACGLAAMVTPMLPGMVRTILHFKSSDPMVASRTITEATFLWTSGFGMVLSALALLTLAWFVHRRERIATGEWIWLAGMTVLMAWYARFTPLFAMIAVPLLGRTLPDVCGKSLRSRAVWLMMAIVLAVGWWRVVDGMPHRGAQDAAWLNRLGPNDFGYPCAAAEFVAGQLRPRSRHLLNGFNWGGYLAWRLPGFQVFTDGRTQCYSAGFWETYFLADSATIRSALTNLLAREGIDAAILPQDDRHFLPVLIELNWRQVYKDEHAVVLVPPDAP